MTGSGREAGRIGVDFGIAGEGPSAIDVVDERVDLAQAGFHIASQHAQIGGGLAGVAGNALRLHQQGVHFFQAGAGIVQQLVEHLHGGTSVAHQAALRCASRALSRRSAFGTFLTIKPYATFCSTVMCGNNA